MNGLRISNPAMLAVSAQSAFDPLSLSPSIWLDASQEAYANNDLVATANDWSGNARHFTEATSKPTFKTAIANGKPAFYFDGSKQLLRSYTGAGTDFSICAVVSRADESFRIFWSNGIDPYFGIKGSRNPSFYQGANVDGIFSAFPDSVSEPQLISVISDSGGTRIIAGKNVFNVGSTTPSPLNVSGLSALGGFQWSGHIMEILATETALSDADYSAYADYCKAEYALHDQRVLMMDGDSITYGSGASVLANSWASLLVADLGSTEWRGINQGIVGQTVGDCTSGGGPAEYMRRDAAALEWTLSKRTSGKNVIIPWGGTNDLFFGKTGEEAYASYLAYCQDARTAGYRVIACTMLDRQTGGGSWTRAKMQAFNTLVRANWATFADALVDPSAADARFDDFASALFADGVHPNDAGHAILFALFRAALNSLSLS